MLGRARGFGVPIAVFIEGADVGNEYLLELAVGERCSADDNDDVDSTEKRGCG
jgi:hypothetical protein